MTSSAQADDRGFTIVEVILAMFIVVSVMVVTLGLVVSSLGTVQLARQRQTGAALATQSLEALRALPYSTVTASGGTACSGHLPADSSGVSAPLAATTQYLDAAHANLAPGASVATSNGVAISEPVVKNTQSPCTASLRVDNTTYHVYQYVTTSGSAYNLTAIVSWAKSRGGTGVSVDRSTDFSPGGCLLDTLHPYSGPCQAAFVGRGSTDLLSVTADQVDPTDSTVPATELGTLTMASASSRVQVEQSVQVLSSLVPSRAGIGGSSPLDSLASNDPSSQAPTSYASSPSVGSVSSLTASPFSMQPSTATSQVSGALAAAPTACALPTSSGAPVQFTTGLSSQYRPCATASQSQSGPTKIDVESTPTALHLFAASSIATSSGGAQYYDSTGTCGGTTPGCSRGVAYRSIDSATFASWLHGGSGLWSISGLKEFAQADRGDTVDTHTSTRAGTLSYVDPANTDGALKTLSLTAAASKVITWDAIPSGDWTVSGTLTIAPSSTLAGGDSACTTAACTTTITSGDISGDFVLTRVSTGATYPVHVSIGGVQAIAGYQKAPQ